jgi:hypothetical protein
MQAGGMAQLGVFEMRGMYRRKRVLEDVSHDERILVDC